MNKKFVFALLSLLSFAGTASAQKYWITNDTAAHNLVWEDKLYRRIEFLSDSLCAGRATGTRGCSEAAFFIINTFRDNGLLPFSDSYVRHIYAGGGVIGHNIIGMIPGSVRIPCDSYVIVGAHYDHLGILGGKMYPGADSNASGTVAMMSLSDMFSAMRRSGRVYGHNIIFVAFDGHNSGLSGSREFLGRFSKEYPFRMMINLDILGSSLVPPDSSRPDYVIALGGIPYMFALERANRGPGLDISYDYYGSEQFTELFYRRIGDQSWFLDAGVPSLMFTSGITLHTNKVGDTVDTLDLDLLSRRITLIREWLISMI